MSLIIKEFKDVDDLSPSDFERFVADIFESSGWSDVHVTEVGKEFNHGDGGVDIFGYKANKKFAIEVKQRNINTNVDIKALNQLVTGAKLANASNKILVTNSYFTSEVQARALRLGVELVDRDRLQNIWVEKHSEIGRKITPRKYQQDIINESLDKIKKGQSKLLIEMATGLGKTYTVALLLKELFKQSENGQRVLFVAHQIEILLQTVTSFKNVFGLGNYSFSSSFAGFLPDKTDFVFASFATLHSNLEKLDEHQFDFIVIDEAHHVAAQTYSNVATHFKPKLLIGLTATPERADNKDVLSFFGGKDGHVGKYDLIWALKHRRLAFPKYMVLLNDLNEEHIEQLESGLTISDLDRHLFLHKKDEEVVNQIENLIKEKEISMPKCIVFCRNIRHINHMLQFFELGTAVSVHSQMSSQDRRSNIRKFRDGESKFILTCDLFNEGVDIPETNILIFLRSTGSRTIWLQQLGRGLRKTKNKEYVHVLDFVANLERVNEIKRLKEQVDRTRIDKESLDPDETEAKELIHDSTIEVNYSKQAAKVLTLLELQKFDLNKRTNLISELNAYYREHSVIPEIEVLEESLSNVSLDQVSTLFDSYFGFVSQSVPEALEIKKMKDEVNGFVQTFKKSNNCIPSLESVAQQFRVKSLYKYTSKEIKSLIPDFQEDNDKNSSEILNTIEATNKQSVQNGKESIYCPVVRKFKHKVKNINDFEKLDEEERNEILAKYHVEILFLAQLKEEEGE